MTDLTIETSVVGKASLGEIWATLSNINCNAKTQKKGNLTYLSWAWAWETLMIHYPNSDYVFMPEEVLGDGSVMVSVELTVDLHKRSMWLPVMDNRNKAMKTPDARDISDTRMRCLVKAMAMFGLGHYIYAGEDLPTVTSGATQGEAVRATKPVTLPASKDIRPDVLAIEVFLEDSNFSNKDELSQYWSSNKAALEKIKSVDKDAYDSIVGLFQKATANLAEA